MFRFLAFVNQCDWRGKQILKLLTSLHDDDGIKAGIELADRDFERRNKAAEKKDKPTIPDTELHEIWRILEVSPLKLGVIDVADNWVMETLKDAGRAPNDNEWQRLKTGPLDGMIGMSFALQCEIQLRATIWQRRQDKRTIRYRRIVRCGPPFAVIKDAFQVAVKGVHPDLNNSVIRVLVSLCLACEVLRQAADDDDHELAEYEQAQCQQDSFGESIAVFADA